MTTMDEQRKQQLLRVSAKKVSKMLEDKKETPSLVIPKSILQFASTPTYQLFLFSLYEYCCSYHAAVCKYSSLREKMLDRVYDGVILLQREKEGLLKMEQELSYQYAGILLKQQPCRSGYKDQFFFETFIYLVSRVIKEFFARENFAIIEEEINRLFRTNRFNIIRKRHENDRIMRQFPALKEESRKHRPNLTSIIGKAPERIAAYRQLEKKKKGRPDFEYSTLLGSHETKDQLQRSPLLCTWLPSKKAMLSEFNRPKFHSLLRVQPLRQHSSSK